jgi:phage-related protein
MTEPIDVAYVDIVARKESLKTFERDIDKTFDKVDKNIKDHLDGVDRDFDNVFKRIGKRFGDFQKKASASLGSFFSTVGGLVGQLGRVVGQLGGTLGSVVGQSPLLVLILALTPAIIALAAALSNLIGIIGILPAGIGVLVAAIVPVVVAFQNFGDAVSALASGDIDKINEALKKLSPSARFVAREIAKLLPLLRSFQRSVQEAFFSQVRGGATQLLGTVLPGIAENFNRVAGSVGRLVSQFITFATSINAMNALNDLLDTTSRIIDKLSGPFIRLFDALAVSVSGGLPFVERLAEAIGRALDQFSAFLLKAIETGEFDKFIEDAIITIKELIALVSAIGGLIGTIFAGTEESGHEFIKTLTDIIIQLDKFFQSAQGQDALKQLVFLVQALGFAIGATVNSLLFMHFIFNNTLKLFEAIGRGFFDLIEIIGDFLPQALEEAKQFIITKFDEIVSFIGSVPSRIAALGPVFLQAGKNLITSFMNGFRAVGSFIGDIAGDIVGSVKGFLNRAIDRINSGIATLDALLPGTLGRIPRLASGAVVRHTPGGILANVGEGREDEVIAPISTLEDIIRKFFGGDGAGGGMTVNFGPGSISIGFGEVPTEEEARGVGRAVADGITTQLAKRNVRTQVRTI